MATVTVLTHKDSANITDAHTQMHMHMHMETVESTDRL